LRLKSVSRVGLECARPECTRRFIGSFAEDAKFESSGKSSSTKAVEAGIGVTRGRGSGTAGGGENRGDPEIASAGAKGARRRGNLRTQTQGEAGRCGCEATCRPHREAVQEEPSCGVTRRVTPSKAAEGCETRGNSKLDRRRSREMQEPGKLGDSSTGATGRVKIRGNPGIYVQ
jgi:hypothetical protein